MGTQTWVNKALSPGDIYNNRAVVELVSTGDRTHRYYRVRCLNCGSERVLIRRNVVTNGCQNCSMGDKFRSQSLAEATRVVPIGSRFGAWEVISEPFITKDRWQGASRVDCRCDCGAIRAVRVNSLTSTRKPSRSCGNQRLHISERGRAAQLEALARYRGISTYKGLEHPRNPTNFRNLFDDLSCRWVRCDPSNLSIQIDHDHRCERHREELACVYCIRGPVHQSCNTVIKYWDFALRQGLLGIPEDIQLYLNSHYQTR